MGVGGGTMGVGRRGLEWAGVGGELGRGEAVGFGVCSFELWLQTKME